MKLIIDGTEINEADTPDRFLSTDWVDFTLVFGHESQMPDGVEYGSIVTINQRSNKALNGDYKIITIDVSYDFDKEIYTHRLGVQFVGGEA